MSKRNPKQEGSNLYDCRVQTGPCPNNCNQCFYNRPGTYYEDINEPHTPTEAMSIIMKGDCIVRMNCGHDSNIKRDLVIFESKKYENVFFNTSIPNFDFPGPVVFTANSKEEEPVRLFRGNTYRRPANLMFIRLRVSSANLADCYIATRQYIDWHIPVVLTFMAYYDSGPPDKINYRWKKRHINSYWCPTPDFMRRVLADMQRIGGRLVTMCGTPTSNYCRDCRNCETYYWQTKRYMEGN